MLPQTAFTKSIWILVVFYLFPFAAFANVVAGFTVSQSGGCAPLMVTFTNTTAGASSAATYEWNFGNGHTSVLHDAAAIFEQEKEYTVTLTVRDGNSVATHTKTITVYKKPQVQFAASIQKGCAPLPVIFTATATPGSGSMESYYWDFGDGYTRSEKSNTTTHTYNTEQKITLSVTATNSFGCATTVQQKDVVDVKEGILIGFEADKMVLCKETDAVQFTNTTTGAGTLQYHWDFGDGQTATAKSPAHTFNKKGDYSVKLTVNSSEGCKAEKTAAAYLNVANFKTNFTVPDLVCRGSNIQFENKSSAGATNTVWEVNGQPAYVYNQHLYYRFYGIDKHMIKLTNKFGDCIDSISKEVVVKQSPVVEGFVADIKNICGAPTEVQFKDTTKEAVAWAWNFDWSSGSNEVHSTEQAPLKTFANQRYYYVQLTVTNAIGCTTQALKHIDLQQPWATINATRPIDGRYCDAYTLNFSAYSYYWIEKYEWDMGDSTTSTSPTPKHVYSKPGEYTIKLRYTVRNGCVGTASYNVVVKKGVKADFYVSQTTTCGKAPVTFYSTSTGQDIEWYNWYVNDVYVGSGHEIRYRFPEPGKYTIKHVVLNSTCHDTLEKKELITVVPPVTKMNGYRTTCDGNRGEVLFYQNSSGATEWLWDFGDGQTRLLTTNQQQVSYTYTKSGRYTVKLTTSNGACSDKDSIEIFVLLKQKPLLTGNKTELCANEKLEIKVDSLDRNYSVPLSLMVPDFRLVKVEYGDGTAFTGSMEFPGYYWWQFLSNFQGGQENIRMIMQSHSFGCYDTTNYLPLKIKGATADFTIENNNTCFNTPIQFKDASRSQYSAIKSREWIFGDGQSLVTENSSTIAHTYSSPGRYNITLKVSDASGCTATSSASAKAAEVFGPKAAFTASGIDVTLNTTVSFFNSTNNYGALQTTYQWTFGDGGSSTEYNPLHTFTKAGTYTVKLVASNAVTQCSSETSMVIRVKNFNSAFSQQTRFIGSLSCPPVLASFTNTSQNFTKVAWDFGDGSAAGNINNPTHIYTVPGTYIVTLYVYGANNVTGQFTDTIRVKKTAFSFAADLLRACTSQSISFKTKDQKTSAYYWDFGDGIVTSGNDSFAVHAYRAPDTYKPKLMIKDVGGCSVVQTLESPLIIDSLSVAMPKLPATICSPKEFFFTPLIHHQTGDGIAQENNYYWNFGTGAAKDTSDVQNPSFVFSEPGNYTIALQVQTPVGCKKNVQAAITVFQGLGGKINGPAEICQQASAQFTGSTLLPGQLKWEWIFHDGTKVQAQNPPAKMYATAGTYDVKLVVDNGGCIDTVVHQLLVHPTPVAQLTQTQINLCLNNSVTLTASGGAQYSWAPAAGLQATTGASVQAAPVSNSTYTVTVTSDKGCVAINTVGVNVVRPMQVQLPAEYVICAGNGVQLQASGAAAYQWILNTEGLSNRQIANPVAKPAATIEYTVVGSDVYQCFKDTAVARVTVRPIPTVNAGDDVEILAGSSHQLSPVASADVVRYQWSPATYLSCTTCATPEARPMQPIDYVLKVVNAHGCSATDTVAIQLMCSESRVFIPDAFSPNYDGKNDLFSIKGQGIRTIKYMRIFNRWGELVFERKDFEVGDAKGAWNGKYKGQLVPSGTYIYFAEMSCNQQTFTRKGTINVVY